jgi:hypothetical protein
MMMSSDHLTYALNSSAWFVGGATVSLVYARWFYHRLLRREGLARKEPPLAVFMAIIVGMVSIVGFLYSASAQITAKDATDKARDAAAAAKDQAAQTRALAVDNRRVAECINKALDQRTKVSDTPALTEEADASRDWASAVLGLFALPHSPTPAQQAAEAKAFQQETMSYLAHLTHAAQVLAYNANYRAAHPLGRC